MVFPGTDPNCKFSYMCVLNKPDWNSILLGICICIADKIWDTKKRWKQRSVFLCTSVPPEEACSTRAHLTQAVMLLLASALDGCRCCDSLWLDHVPSREAISLTGSQTLCSLRGLRLAQGQITLMRIQGDHGPSLPLSLSQMSRYTVFVSNTKGSGR